MVQLITTSNSKANTLLEEVLCEVEQAKENNQYFSFPISNQLDKTVGTFKSTRVYGYCIKTPYTPYKIALNEYLLEKGTDREIKEVLLHELVHACGINGHKWQFKNQANRIYCVMKYDVQKKYTGILPRKNREEHAKYKVICNKCGKVFYRMKRSNLVKYPNIYTHSCGGNFTVEKVR